MLTAVAVPESVEIAEKSIGKSVQNLDMSLWGLITHADFVVQLVMLILLVGSIISWAIIINKALQIKKLNSHAVKFNKSFWHERTLENFYDRVSNHPQDPYESVFCIGMSEWKEGMSSISNNKVEAQSSMPLLQERVEKAMHLSIEKKIAELRKGLIFLATLASSAPFIGLLGTVWGIMSSFQSIAIHQNTNLSVVAPGIAEALFTTALGLFAAIPAVIFYNIFSQNIGQYTSNLEAFIDEFINIISRQMDRINTKT